MKKIVFLLILLIVGTTSIYYYLTNPDFKSGLDNWFGITKYDSLQNVPKADTTTYVTPRTKKKRTKERNRIPKKLKPGPFDKLDEYARNTPDKYSHSIKDLANYLAIPAKNDLDRSRLAFTWIATHVQYDAEAYNTGNYGDEFSADTVLMRRKGVCEGYSTLFMEIALMMNLEVVKIGGYAKGYGLGTNKKFTEANHAWNAVRIDDKWQLIDVTWGSGYGYTKNNKLETVMEFDPYWFCVKPLECIFSHLPEEREWQLIQSTISLSQFENLPYLDKSFFELGFDADEVFNKAIAGNVDEFADTYSVGFPIKQVGLPFIKTIERGSKYSFVFQSDYVDHMAIIDGEQWTYFKKEDGKFSALHVPVSDKLKIAVKINWFDIEYKTIIIYRTDAQKI
jgi:hypothetical protein